MFWLNCMFFKSWRYYYPVPMSRLTVLFISLVRGIVGGAALYTLLNFIMPHLGSTGMNWGMVTDSGWFYVVMFCIGFCWVQVFVWSLIILLPLQALGYLDPIIEWIGNAIIFILIFMFYIISQIANMFKREPAES